MERREITRTWSAGDMQEEDPLQRAVAFTGVCQSIQPNLEQRQVDRTSSNITEPPKREIPKRWPAGGMQEEDPGQGTVDFTEACQPIRQNLEQRQAERMSNNMIGPQKREITKTWPAGGMQEEDPRQGTVAFSGAGRSIPPNVEQRPADRTSYNITEPQKREIPKRWPAGDMQEEDPRKGTVDFTEDCQPIRQNLEQRQAERMSNNMIGPQKREITRTWSAGGMQEEDPRQGTVDFTEACKPITQNLEQRQAERMTNNMIGLQKREITKTWPAGGMQEEDPRQGTVAFSGACQPIRQNLEQRQVERISNNMIVPQKREITKTWPAGGMQEEDPRQGTVTFSGAGRSIPPNVEQRPADRTSSNITEPQKSEKVNEENANITEAPNVSQQLNEYEESQKEGPSYDDIPYKTEAFPKEWKNISTRRKTEKRRLYPVCISEKVTEDVAMEAEAQNNAQELCKYKESQKEGPSNDENSNETEVAANDWIKGNQERLSGRSAGRYDVHYESKVQLGGPSTSKGMQEEDARKGAQLPITPNLEQRPGDRTSDDITEPEKSEKVTEETENVTEAQNDAQELCKYTESQKEGSSNDDNSIVIEVQANGWKKFARKRKTGKSAGRYDMYLESPRGTRIRSKSVLLKHIRSYHVDVDPEDFDFSRPFHLQRRATRRVTKNMNKENEDRVSTWTVKGEDQVHLVGHTGDAQNTEDDLLIVDDIFSEGNLLTIDSIARSKEKRKTNQCFPKKATSDEVVPCNWEKSVRDRTSQDFRKEQESVRSRAQAPFKNKPHTTSEAAFQQVAVLAEEAPGPSNVLRERRRHQQESQESNIEDRRMQRRSHYQTGQAMLWSGDVFNDLNDPRVIFCRSLLPMLENLDREREKQAKCDIYRYLTDCLSTNDSVLSPR